MKSKDELFREVMSLVKRYRRSPLGGGCIYSTLFGMMVLRKNGYKAVLQAGSACFQFRECDDGGATHFSYVWSPEHPASRIAAMSEREDPPQYIWESVSKIPQWAIYTPSREATIFVGDGPVRSLIKDLGLC